MRRETRRLARWIGAAALLASTLTVAMAIPPGEIILGNVVVFRLRNGSGKLDLTIGSETFTLESGDAVYFDSSVRHSYHRASKTQCTGVIVAA